MTDERATAPWIAWVLIGGVGACSKPPAEPPHDPAPAAKEAPMNDAPEPEEPPVSDQPPAPGEDFKIDIHQRVALTTSVDITFHRHTHKISEGDFESPLGVSLIVHEGGQDEPWDGWVDLSGARALTVAGVELELVDYGYGKWMQLRVKSADAR